MIAVFPLEVRPVKALFAAYAAFFLLMAVVMLLPPVIWLAGAQRGLTLGIAALLATVFSITCSAIVVTTLRDLFRQGPSVIIDQDGYQDFRSATAVRWADVAYAEFIPGRGWALRLRLRPPPRRCNPFRIGQQSRRGTDLTLPLQFMTPSPGQLAQVVAERVKQARGEVAGYSEPAGVQRFIREPMGPSSP